MKRKLEKILICILIFFVLNNFFISSFSGNMFCTYASTGEEVETEINGILSTVVGLLTWPIRIVALAAGLALDKLLAGVAYIEDSKGATLSTSADITPFDILFNKCSLLKINFFSSDGIKSDSILYKFRSSIAVWYYAMRTLASAILLVILIYVGIRMALSTVSADKKASYKKMLVDWVVSLVIIFLLQYIMLFVMYVNDAIVSVIESFGGSTSIDIAKSIDNLATQALESNVQAIAATIIYCMLVFQTFALFISYFNRMLKLAFLTIISPLITLTYSIDKMGDGKAQALNTWLKEYIFTILIQPFHCIIYMTFINVAFELLNKSSSGTMEALATSIIAILCINFIKEAEKIVRKIFAFQDDSQNTSLSAGMAVAAVAASKSKNIGKNTRKAVNGMKNFKSNVGNSLNSAKVDAIAIGRVLRGNNKDESGNRKSVSEIKSDVRTEINNKKAEKEENKRYGVRSSDPDVQKAIEERANALEQSTGMTRKEALSQARLSVAKENRKAKKQDNFAKKHPTITSARGKIKAVKEIAQQSEVLKQLGGLANTTIAAGMGLALGSGIYGLNGKITESALAGIAMGKGTSEFLTHSNKTLRNDTNDRLNSLGVTGKADAAQKINEIIANSDKYEGTDELNKIMKELEKALTNAGLDKNKKNQLKKTIENKIANNPSADISSIIAESLKANGIEGANKTPELEKVTEKLAGFTQEKAIYNDIKQAGDIGIAPDTFVADIIKSYNGTGNSSNVTLDSEFLDDAVEITQSESNKDEIFRAPDDNVVEEFVNSKNERDLDVFYKECDRRYNRAHDAAEKATEEALKKELIAEMNQILAAKAKVQDIALDREISRIKGEYQEALDKANDATTREAKRAVDKELKNLQQQYDKYIAEAQEHLNRADMEGTKSALEINLQKADLETERNNIKTTRENLRR